MSLGAFNTEVTCEGVLSQMSLPELEPLVLVWHWWGWGVLDSTCHLWESDLSQPGGKAHTMQSGQELGDLYNTPTYWFLLLEKVVVGRTW